MTDARKLVAVARIRRAHGVRGGLAVVSFAEADLDRLLPPGEAVCLSSGEPAPGQAMTHRVASCRPLGDDWLLALEGLDSRERAQGLSGRYVGIAAADLPLLEDDDEVYLHELKGLTVRTKASLAGKLAPPGAGPDEPVVLGRLEGLLDAPGQDLWVIRAPGGQEILFPATEDTVEGIDTDQGLVDILPPPGLVDLAFPEPRPEAAKRATPRSGPKARAAKSKKERSVTEPTPEGSQTL